MCFFILRRVKITSNELFVNIHLMSGCDLGFLSTIFSTATMKRQLVLLWCYK